MTRSMSMIEARSTLTHLPEELGAVAVTRRGKPVLAVLPWELYEAIMETLEIMEDADLMAALRRSIQEATCGQAIPWETAKAELGL